MEGTCEMNTKKSGSKKSKNKKDAKDSDDGSCEESVGGNGLKKGPWTAQEDAVLIEYVKNHGEGNWNSVQNNSGLSRCGKSCRLRWANHLRPDLKKGAFTQDEVDLIVRFHAKFGNKWARLAAELPGRTDNEIKNFWNTRSKKLQRAGLPLYPANVWPQSIDGSEEQQNEESCQPTNPHSPDPMQMDSFEQPETYVNRFSCWKTNYYYAAMLDLPASGVEDQGMASSLPFTGSSPTSQPCKRYKQTEVHYQNWSECDNIAHQDYNQFTQPCENIPGPLLLGVPYEADLPCTYEQPVGLFCGVDVVQNVIIPSSSEPHFGCTKMELPSLQYTEPQLGSWVLSSPLTSVEPNATLIQTSLDQIQMSESQPLISSGLLEAVLQESRSRNSSMKNCRIQRFPDASDSLVNLANGASVIPTMMQSERSKLVDSNSPLGCSASSLFSDCTPAKGNSLDEAGRFGMPLK